MAGIFGAVGAVTAAELDEMARRLRHRGGHASWREIAAGVFFGRVASTALPRSQADCVVDLPEPLDATAEYLVSQWLQAQTTRELSGPFAGAYWNDLAQETVLARDLLGLKPLHYARLPGGGFVFATEYKALLAIEQLPTVVDRAAVQYLQTYKAVPANRTLLTHIHVVPPGCALHLDRNGSQMRVRRMPEVRLAVSAIDEKRAARQLLAKLDAAVDPLVANRAVVGFALSGGIDSMTVAHIARRCAPHADFVAFTAAQGPKDAEVARAALTADSVGARHVIVETASSDLAGGLPRAVWHLENPIGRTETFQFLAIARAAQDAGLSRLLTGMGADLLFAGMPRHRVLWLAERLPWLRKDLLQFYLATQNGCRPERLLARLMTQTYYAGSFAAPPQVSGQYDPIAAELLSAPGPEFLNRCLLLDGPEPTSRTLARIERPFQAHGIEYASPFLDRTVIDFAFQLPSELKIRRGTQKYILRYAMRGRMLERLRRAPKDLMRIHPDPKFCAVLLELADVYLHAERVRRRGLFEWHEVQRVVGATHKARHPEMTLRLWTLLLTEIWAEIFVDGRGRHPSPSYVPTLATAWTPAHAPTLARAASSQ